MALLPLQSITGRLILSLTFATTLLWCAAAIYASFVSYRELNEVFDRTLEQVAHHLLPLAIDDVQGQSDDTSRSIDQLIANHGEYLSYRLRDSSGRTLLCSDNVRSPPYRQTPRPGFSSIGGYRVYSATDNATGFTITVAEDTQDRREAVAGGAGGMALSLFGVVPLSALAIWLAVRGAMKPVSRLSADIAQRSGRNLAPLDITDQPIELRPIAEATALLVEGLRAALDAERAFAANSAHELRTPIAGALAQTQRTIAELRNPRDRRRAREVEATLKRLSALAEKLMQLSRVDAGVSRGDRDVDLVPVLDLVARDGTSRLSDPERIHYSKPEGLSLVAHMDMDAFAIAVRNLIDNAINHGASDGRIDIIVERSGEIRIINEGPVIAPSVLASLKTRFARGETSHGGSGLGLAIVETIVTQTEGKLELFSPATGRRDGFEARLTIRLSEPGDRIVDEARAQAARASAKEAGPKPLAARIAE